MHDVDVCWHEDEEWRGYLPIAPRSELLQRHVFDTWVAGVHHYPDAVAHESFAPGRPIALIPEPDNPFDPAAVGVWNAELTLKTGHLPAVIVRGLAPTDRTGVTLSEQFDAGRRVSLRVLVSRDSVRLNVVPDSEERAAWRRSTVARLTKAGAKQSAEPWPVPEGDPMEQMAKMLRDLEGKGG